MRFFTNLLLFSLATPVVLSHSPSANASSSLPKPTDGPATNQQHTPLTLDDFPVLGKVLSGLGLDSKLNDPAGMAHSIIDSAFDSMAGAATALPGDGPTIGKALRKTKELVHQKIAAHPGNAREKRASSDATSILPRLNTDDELKSIDQDTTDGDSEFGDVLAQEVKVGCRSLSVILYLTVHLLRALLDSVIESFAAILESMGILSSLAYLLRTLGDILHQSLTSAADVLKPENICGDDA